MTTFKKFEDIHAWKKGRAVATKIFRITNDGSFAKDFTLKDQIKRSIISIMANIAEGHGRRSRSEFANFLNIARGSATTETQSHLYVALDLKYLIQEDFDEIYELLEEVSKMTISLAKYLRNSNG